MANAELLAELALEEPDSERCFQLIRGGACANAVGIKRERGPRTLLMVLARRGDLPGMRELIGLGADPSFVLQRYPHGACGGYTYCSALSASKLPETVRFLVNEYGVSLADRRVWQGLWSCAVRSSTNRANCLEMALTLISFGIPPSVQLWHRSDGVTALHDATDMLHLELVQSLLDYGADPCAGEPPVQWIRYGAPEDRTACRELILDAPRAWNASVTLVKLCELRLLRNAWPWYIEERGSKCVICNTDR